MSGGYFTDFYKCLIQTYLDGRNKLFLIDDRPISGTDITWFDIYVDILKQEISLITKYFGISPKHIIIWGSSIYDLMENTRKHSKNWKKTSFDALFKDKGCDVLFFGLHYSGTNVFSSDKGKGSKRKSCLRIYSDIVELKQDRKDDLKRSVYTFGN